MPLQETIRVDLKDRSYDIMIGSGLLETLDYFPAFADLNHAIVVTDSNVGELYLDQVQAGLQKGDVRLDTIIIPAGEESKCVATLERLWNQLLDFNTDRKSTIIALGGGVVGDLAGFAAASFARGIDLIQIPTSLLAQVDSSVGGKTGINLPGSKNMVGAFWQPQSVIIDTNVLCTLDTANFRAGLAEVVKYGVIMDADFFTFLQQQSRHIIKKDQFVLAKLIARCCQLKASVVQEDETEQSGRRAILNYGHTFGHAIENVFGYGHYLHGEAIAIGMHCAAKLALHLGWVDQDFVDQQRELVERFELPTEINDSGRKAELVQAMHRDKKVMGGVLKLILPTRLGSVEHCDAPPDDVLMGVF